LTFSGTQTVFSCKEHSNVTVPFRLLLDENGSLDLYPEVSGKGYFDIDYRQGQLSLRAKGFVGLIPLSDNVAIHVEPRAPIGNLLYMIWRAGVGLTTLEGFVRGYQDRPGEVDDAEELYVATFIRALREMKSRGILKKYASRETQFEKRGRLLIGPTVSRFHSRGLRQNHVFQVNDLTVNNRENQILKYTVDRLLRHFVRDPNQNREVARDLLEIDTLFRDVDSSAINPSVVAREVVRLIRGLPNSHKFYEPALWLCYLIAIKAGITMEQVGRAKFESVIIDVSKVFEHYVRKLCEEAADSHFGGCRVFDGNRQQVPLFVTNNTFLTQPDYYFRRDRIALALADAKYKPKIDTEDRYALVAFCEALNVKKSAFVCPQFGEQPLNDHQGTTRGGIEIHVVRIDLNAADLHAEELRFKSELATALGLASV